MSKSLLIDLRNRATESAQGPEIRGKRAGTALAKVLVTMTKNSVTKLALILVGFFSGAVGGVALVQAAPLAQEQTAAVALHGVARPVTTLGRINDVAVDCGIYGLPGSPAVVALTAGRDGRPVKAVIESDIFGGEDAEACILGKLAGLPMSQDTVRAVLQVHVPEDTSDALATR